MQVSGSDFFFLICLVCFFLLVCLTQHKVSIPKKLSYHPAMTKCLQNESGSRF